jgi:uncharacterized protein YggE
MKIFKAKGSKSINKINNFFLSIVTISFLILLVLILTIGCGSVEGFEHSQPGEATEQAAKNTISVTGTGIVKVIPDEVLINISIITEEKTSEKAVNQNSQITNKVISVIEKTVAENLKIETTGYNLTPLYDYTKKNKPPQIYGYRVTSILEVSTTEIEKIGQIMADAIDAGANNIFSLRSDLSEELKRKSKRDALQEATGDAKDKAQAIAESLGLELGKISYISESGTSYPGPIYRMGNVEAEEASAGDAEEIVSPSIVPQEIEIIATVEAAYNFKD